MRYLHYAGGHMLLADMTCKAVLRYSRALAMAGESDVITVPVITDGGSQASAHLLIGPASEFFSTPVENASEEPFDKEVIEHLEKETRRLQPSRPVWSAEMLDIPDIDFDYDLEVEVGRD